MVRTRKGKYIYYNSVYSFSFTSDLCCSTMIASRKRNFMF